MKRALFLAVSLAALVALADWPVRPASVATCSRKVVQYTAFIPHALQLRLQDAGFPIVPTPGQPYKRLKGRAWVCPTDAGTVVYPPKLAKRAEYFRPDLTSDVDSNCSDGVLCDQSNDGDNNQDDADPLVETPFECACAKNATCLSPDGGAAPLSVTLQPGQWSGAGCKPKPCGSLWIGSGDSSWPAVCP